MKKKVLSIILALTIFYSYIPVVFATDTVTPGFENFTKKSSYKAGQFTDFLSSDWFSANIITAYELGLVKGTTATNFNPKGNITVAETIALACRLHSTYNSGASEFTQGTPWYKVYVDYALANKIIPGTYSDYNAKISRANFAYILNNALPAEALKGINNIVNGVIPDVAEDNRTQAIYNLYRAGILTGNDKYGTFNPNSNIQRSEVAAIVTRMADKSQRKMFKLEEKPAVPESVTLAGKTVIEVGETTQWKATVSPTKANQWVSWASGNPAVATVDANGNIKGLKAGQANITATAVNGIKKTVLINVEKATPISAPTNPDILPFSFERNSVDGIKLCWKAKNKTNKTINYYTIRVYFYNSVGDPAYDEITGKTYKDVKYVGPIAPDSELVIYSIVGYVPACAKVVLGETKLEYSDGTIENFWYGWSTSTRR